MNLVRACLTKKPSIQRVEEWLEYVKSAIVHLVKDIPSRYVLDVWRYRTVCAYILETTSRLLTLV